MRKPVVDYREFRFSRLNEPRFAHLKYLGGWIVYFILYLLTENLIPAENCHPIHCALDDIIPFNELFFIPYTFWYLLIIISLVWFALYNTERFRTLQIYIIVTQLVAMAVYIIYPSRQDLRPVFFERDNVLTRIAGAIYALDTNTGVCPSLHVAYSLGIASTWVKEKTAKSWWKAFVVFSAVLISISTAFVKQHSVVDIIAALPLGLLAEAIAYGPYWKEKFRNRAAKRNLGKQNN